MTPAEFGAIAIRACEAAKAQGWRIRKEITVIPGWGDSGGPGLCCALGAVAVVRDIRKADEDGAEGPPELEDGHYAIGKEIGIPSHSVAHFVAGFDDEPNREYLAGEPWYEVGKAVAAAVGAVK